MPKSSRLVLPSLRAKMGDWIYYASIMKMRDIAKRVRPASEFNRSEALRDLIQRELSDRSDGIAEYLIRRGDRFFNSLVIAVQGGDPDWYGVDIASTPYVDIDEDVGDLNETMGVLVLNGEERMFALDGQHRVAGMQAALEEKPGLRNEEVAVLFVAHFDDTQGMQRSRRLFTTLNRYAKPVSKSEIVALDEDDLVAITTRRIVEDHPLFAGKRVSLAKGKNIPVSDKASLTTIVALYDVLDIHLRDAGPAKWKDKKTHRVTDAELDRFYRKAVTYWSTMTRHFPALRQFQDAPEEANKAGELRTRAGGHLLFRPVGQLIAARVARRFTEAGLNLQTAIKQMARVPMQLHEAPWMGLLWDGKRMLTESVNQRAAETVMYYGAGGEVSRDTLTSTRTTIAERTNRIPGEVRLRRYL